jgi:hypothetical protein
MSRRICSIIMGLSSNLRHKMPWWLTVFALLACVSSMSRSLFAQNTPLISGGLGFLTNSSTTSGGTSYQMIAVPVLEAPIGPRFLVESRGNLVESFSPQGNGQGYDTSAFLGLAYLQADYLATSHVTAVAGYFLTPFGTYNERLSPIWISNFQDAPLIFGIGTMPSAAGTGGMLRGNAYSNEKVSISYAAYFSSDSHNKQFQSSRSTGGQVSAYFPQKRLEIGTSYGRSLEGAQSNSFGAHVWWEPAAIPLKIRSEYAHDSHTQGYWIESAYRLSQIGGENSWIGRLEPVFRLQQTFRDSPGSGDFVPAQNTQRTDFALEYHVPHEVRINASYERQFSSAGNFNVWQTGIVYRFLTPVWKGK